MSRSSFPPWAPSRRVALLMQVTATERWLPALAAHQIDARFTDSSRLRGDAAALRARANADGYLFLRDVVDRGAVLALRDRFRQVGEALGLLEVAADGKAL